MKKYSNGWGLSTMLLMVGVILIALLTATFFTIRMNALLGKNNNESETKLQKAVNETYYIGKMNELTLATSRYIDDYNIDLTNGIIRINLSTLINEEYMTSIKDTITNSRCNGYSEAYINQSGIKQVNSYIKCDSYTTPNYRE